MKDYMQNNRWITIDKVFIFLIGLLIFTISLNPEFIAFQTRFALFAQDMFFHGITAFPTTYQGPYPDYPALPTIMIYAVSKLFGQVTPFTAILPTATISALILVFIYQIGSLHSRKWGWLGVFFALFSECFFTNSRSIAPDQYVSLATVISFYIIYTADLYNLRKRLWLLPLLLIFGFVFRGPIGLVIPTGVICGYYLCNKDWKRFFILSGIALTLFLICGAILLAAAYHQGGIEFAKNVLTMEAVGRLDEHANTYSFFFYWYDSLSTYAITFPIALCTIIAILKRIWRPQNKTDYFLRYLTLWLIIILLGMSIPGAKRARYLLSIVPAIALLAAYIFINPDKQRILTGLRKFFTALCYLLPMLSLAATIALYYVNRSHHYQIAVHYPSVISITLIASLLVWFAHFRLRYHTIKTYLICTIALLIFIFSNICILEPINYAIEKTQPFVQAIKTLQARQYHPFVFYKIGPDAEDIKFMVNLNQPIKPIFIQNQSVLLHYQKPVYFIALLSDFSQLPQDSRIQVLYKGKIGHRKSVIFRLK